MAARISAPEVVDLLDDTKSQEKANRRHSRPGITVRLSQPQPYPPPFLLSVLLWGAYFAATLRSRIGRYRPKVPIRRLQRQDRSLRVRSWPQPWPAGRSRRTYRSDSVRL